MELHVGTFTTTMVVAMVVVMVVRVGAMVVVMVVLMVVVIAAMAEGEMILGDTERLLRGRLAMLDQAHTIDLKAASVYVSVTATPKRVILVMSASMRTTECCCWVVLLSQRAYLLCGWH